MSILVSVGLQNLMHSRQSAVRERPGVGGRGMIHKYSMNGFNIVLDTNSGAIHILDDVAYDILDCFHEGESPVVARLAEKYGESDVRGGFAEILALKESGALFSGDIFGDLPGGLSQRPSYLKALCLNVAHECNLRCAYCFASEGKYGGVPGLMSREIGEKAVDFLISSSGNRKNLEIDFFGGEPTLNFGVVKAVVEYARSLEKASGKRFRFTITTNGLLIDDEIENFINDHMYNVVLSLDGRRETNDRFRVRADGSGSYDIIAPKFQKLVEKRGEKSYYVRGTFTRLNLDFTEDVLELFRLGFRHVSIEPVVAAKNEPYSIRQEDVPAICDEYERLAKRLIEIAESGEKFDFFHFMIDLTGGPCAYKRVAGCGAGRSYLAVAPDGALYPCHQFDGAPRFKIGDVENGVTVDEIGRSFASSDVYSKAKCAECWAKFFCGGGCAANAFGENGDISQPYEIGCQLLRKRVECAIMMKASGA
jgi:uncharacterized protein